MINTNPLKGVYEVVNMQLYNIDQVVEILSISPKTIRTLMDAGELAFIKMTPGPRGSVRFSDKDIEAFINSHRVDAKEVTSRVLHQHV